MSTNYPGSLDTYSDKTDNVDTVYAADVNQPNDAVIAVETKIGTGASTPVANSILTGTGAGTSGWGTTLDTDGTLAANSDTKIPSQKAVKTYVDTTAPTNNPNLTYYGMARQAIINGNFDVWQRGISKVIIDATANQFLADRWIDYADKNGGTLPTLTRSLQFLTPGDITGVKYFSRLTTNGAGTSLGVNSVEFLIQKIENGVLKLCGLNKKITVSFWARSDIANKRICPAIKISYGTGGSPSTGEAIKGTPITLTSSWVKYTETFTTNTLVGKTFGTNADDLLELDIWHMWGTTIGNNYVQTSVTAETFVGAGNIDIAQVQLCSGDVALPFQPKSLKEELSDCLRYYIKSPGSTTTSGYSMVAYTTTSLNGSILFPVPMRTAPTISNITTRSNGDGSSTVINAHTEQLTTSGINSIYNITFTSGSFTAGHWEVIIFEASAEL